METGRSSLSLIRLWAGDDESGEEKKWMEGIVSQLGESEHPLPPVTGGETGQINWGLLRQASPPLHWPITRGRWIVSSSKPRHLLSIPRAMNLYAFIPSFERAAKAVAAVRAVLYGFRLTVDDRAGDFDAEGSAGGNDEETSNDHISHDWKISAREQRHEILTGGFDGISDEELPGNGGLSPRELFVLELLASGASNKRIAIEAGISESTVKFHMASVFRKLHSRNRAQAVYEAFRRGLLVI